MIKVARQVAQAFAQRRHTRVINNTVSNGDEVRYHGSRIAWREPRSGMIYTSLCGYATLTTRDRVNAICEALGFGRPYRQADHQQYYDGRPICAHDATPLTGELAALALLIHNR